jgi:hypothetical protein
MRLWGLAAIAACSIGSMTGQPVRFNRDVRPILSDRCYSCHGPDRASRKSTLRLDHPASAKAALTPGDPAASELFRRITSTNTAQRMPPAYLGHDRLSDAQIEVLRRWIEQGAVYEPHWSLTAPKRPPVPKVAKREWVRNPIDAFLLERLERDGLKPSPEAGRAALLRRVTLDLTGLPPTPSELDAFLKDDSRSAYQRVVDRLLASPRYAERMAIRWLEAARYAETNGYSNDGVREMWRYRDWVIDAFRRNMPFDQFTVEQLAGDLLPDATLSQKIATGFHRNHRTSAEGGIVAEEFRVEYVADRVETTGTVWLGLTVGCARCHDHKYDAITQKEYYQLFAFFNNVPEKGFVYSFGNQEPWIKAPLPDQQKRLEDLDRKVAAARNKAATAERKAQKAEKKWLQSAAAQSPDWTVNAGQVFHDPVAKDHFDGKDFVTAGNDVAKFNYRDPFTFSAWIKPESPNGAILSKAEDYFEGQGHALYVLDGKVRLHVIFRWTDLGMRVESADRVLMNEWQHVLVTYDGQMKASGVHIYIDGREQKLNVLFDQCIWPLGPNEPFRIGAGGGLRFTGSIRDVRVYDRAVTPAEAAVIALRDSVAEAANVQADGRSPAQRDKLHMCFLEKYAPPEIATTRSDLAAVEKERQQFYESIPTTMVMAEQSPRRETFLLKRGAYDAPAEKVERATPAALPPFRADWPNNRLGLARWLVDGSHPLTARVAVNRLWQMIFGTGLVKTVEDFGSQGEWPVHPELLDWLAVEFIESGWDVKAMLRLMVTSAAYMQSSKVTPELLEKDPDNRLLARGPRYRLPAEMIRDQALAWSGLLVEKTGGPSVRPYQPPGLWQELAGGRGYQPDKGEGLYRRSLYTYWKRTVAPPGMITFDSPDRETCVVRETRTNTPLQALHLMNDTIFLEASRKLAERMLHEGGASVEERVAFGVKVVLARAPRAGEVAILERSHAEFAEYYRGHADEANRFISHGDSAPDPRNDPADLAAYAAVASLLMNTDEAVTKQ